MSRHFAAVLVLFGVVPLTPAQKPPEPAPDQPTVVKLAPSATGKKTRALQYTLLPDPLDLKPGNAATFWRRAGRAAIGVQRKLTDKEYAWLEMPLKDLPRKDVRAYLDLYAAPLRLAEQAARCDHCDWEMPALTMQNLQDLPFDEIQSCREIANLLQLRCRLEMSDGKFDDAIHTLQSGFALARDLGNADLLIQDLVGIAVAAIMFGRVEELMQIPGSPNLFWALTALPNPLIDIRRAFQVELNTIYRSFPQLRELERHVAKKPLSAKETEKLIDEFLDAWVKMTGGDVPAWEGKAGLAVMALKVYPDAKKYLADQGYAKEEIEALPALQAVFVWYLDQYNRTRDDVLKWLNAPPWQAQAKIEDIAKETTKAMKAGNAISIIGLLLPAVAKTYGAYVRTEHMVGRLRCAEALRLYAAEHDGKAPEKFADLADLPLPINAYTGKGFDEFYHFKDGKGVLETPAPPPLPKSFARRYEIGK